MHINIRILVLFSWSCLYWLGESHSMWPVEWVLGSHCHNFSVLHRESTNLLWDVGAEWCSSRGKLAHKGPQLLPLCHCDQQHSPKHRQGWQVSDAGVPGSQVLQGLEYSTASPEITAAGLPCRVGAEVPGRAPLGCVPICILCVCGALWRRM